MITIIVTLNDEEEKLMRDMVPDIEKWITAGPLKEKCANHKSRIADMMRKKLEAMNATSIPNADELVRIYFSDPNYKDRSEQLKEAKIEALEKPNKKNKPAE